jgi:adhesin transport system outer membrane protein
LFFYFIALFFSKGVMKHAIKFTILFATVQSFTANATDFVDIIRMTESHPSIQSAQSAAGAAFFDINAAQAANQVQLSAGLSSVGYSGQPGYENNVISPHINISKVLYDHGRTDATVQGKQAAYQMQRAQIQATRESINQQALSLFTTAVMNAKVVAVLDSEITALKDLLQRVQAISSIDSGRASEVNQVATRLSSVIASREASNIAQQQAWTQLEILVRKPITLTNELPDLRSLHLLPDSLGTAENVLKEHPSFVVARFKRDAAMANVQLASKWNRPQWSVQLSFNSPRTNGELEPFKAATLQLSSDVSLWDGGAGSASLKGESQRLASAEQDLDVITLNLKQQLEQLWISVPLREQQLRALLQQSTSALQTWRAGETQFFAGQRPLTDLISFVTDYYSSLASYEEQKVQYLASQWQIVAALGKLSDLAKNINTLPGQKLSLTNKQQQAVPQNIIEQTANLTSVAPADDKDVMAFKQAITQHIKIASSSINEKKLISKADENETQPLAKEKDSLRAWPWE